MAKHDEISSTERLLNLIRHKSNTKGHTPNTSRPHSPIRGRKFSLGKALDPGKTVTIGVDIGHADLKLVKISQSSDKNPKLLDYKTVPFEPGISRDSPQFSHFLNSAMTNFCTLSRKTEIWSTAPWSRVDTRRLKIPRVPKKQMSNAAYWTYKKDVPFNDKEGIFDFEILGNTVDEGIQKTEVMAYAAPKEEVEHLRDLFSKSGIFLKGVTIPPLAYQNLLRTEWIETLENRVCMLHIGMDWSRIDIFSDAILVMSRDIKTGMNSMIEAIGHGMRQNQEESPLELELVDNQQNSHAGTPEEIESIEVDMARKILLGLIQDSGDLQEEWDGFNLKEQEIFGSIVPVLERLVGQVGKTLKHYALRFGNENIGKILVSGELSTCEPLVAYIRDQLGVPVEAIDPFASGALLSSEISEPKSASERASFTRAIGVALSRNPITPNFLFTYKEKEKVLSIRRINRTVFGVFLLAMAVCTGISFWQGQLIAEKKAQAAKLQQQMEKCGPYVNQDLILKQVAQIKRNRQTLKAYGKKYLGMAVINEISNLTPQNIQLLSLTANLRQARENKSEKQKKFIILDGAIFGDRQTIEASLAGYLVRLRSSPLFGLARIEDRSFEFLGGKEILRFHAHLELAENINR